MMTGKSEQIGIITKTTTLKTTTACREYLTESLASTKWKQSDVVPLINAFKDLDLSARDGVVFSKSIIKILRKSPVDCLEDLTIAALQFVQRKVFSPNTSFLNLLIFLFLISFSKDHFLIFIHFYSVFFIIALHFELSSFVAF